MLDERTRMLLGLINDECLNGGYKVFSVKELIDRLSEAFIVDIETLNESLFILAQKEYISIKYQDENEILIATLSKGRLERENRIENEIDKMEHERKYFLFAFLGGLFGGAISIIIALLIFLSGGR